eukprot:4733602-Ditylum_brightwellii.AAC.1
MEEMVSIVVEVKLHLDLSSCTLLKVCQGGDSIQIFFTASRAAWAAIEGSNGKLEDRTGKPDEQELGHQNRC